MSQHPPPSIFARYVAFAEKRARWLLLGLGLLGLLSIVPILGLELHTDLTEILPDQHPAVIAFRRISGRQKSSTNLVLMISSPDPQANQRMAEMLSPELDKLVGTVFTEIQWRPETDIPDYYQHWSWLYADLGDLQHAEELLDRILARRHSPLFVDLEGDPEKELRGLREHLRKQVPARSEATYFSSNENGTHYLGAMMWRRSSGLAGMEDQQTLARVKEVVQNIHPERFHPAMKVEYTGNIDMAIEEHDAVRDDLTLATGVCVTLVMLSIYLYFRRFGVLFLVGAPAVLGLLLSLALARFTIHFLNANTAFLISIILGNGINTPIILLARYGEERRASKSVAAALTDAMDATLRATLVATCAASIAYGCLLLTSLRGLSQFGLVGGAGMLLVWIVTFLLVPPLVLFGERVRGDLLTPRPALWGGPFALLGRFAGRYPMLLAVVCLVLLGLSVVPVARYLRDPLEWNMGNLRQEETGAQKRWGRMWALGMGPFVAGYIGTDGVLMVDRADQADAVAEAMFKKDQALGARSVLKAVRPMSAMLPNKQDEKLAVLARIRQKIEHNQRLMDVDERRDVESFRPPDYLRKISAMDLPKRIRDSFTEVDETAGRLIGIDAAPDKVNEKDGHDLLREAHSMQVDALGKTWVAAAAAPVFGGMLETILSDGPKVTLGAVLGVTLLVLLAFGLRDALPVLASLGIGLTWLIALLQIIQLKINFVNFVALSITLGVGTEYATNIWERLRREGLERLDQVLANTGSAVALCSLTTIIGYSSLLLARNRALKSFGLLADLGEITCLLAALLALPALARLVRKGR